MDVEDVPLLAMESDSTIAAVVPAAARKSKRMAEELVTGVPTRTRPRRWKVPSMKRKS
jgi:hypothetical protein